jgi:hypothetical protein
LNIRFHRAALGDLESIRRWIAEEPGAAEYVMLRIDQRERCRSGTCGAVRAQLLMDIVDPNRSKGARLPTLRDGLPFRQASSG